MLDTGRTFSQDIPVNALVESDMMMMMMMMDVVCPPVRVLWRRTKSKCKQHCFCVFCRYVYCYQSPAQDPYRTVGQIFQNPYIVGTLP